MAVFGNSVYSHLQDFTDGEVDIFLTRFPEEHGVSSFFEKHQVMSCTAEKKIPHWENTLSDRRELEHVMYLNDEGDPLIELTTTDFFSNGNQASCYFIIVRSLREWYRNHYEPSAPWACKCCYRNCLNTYIQYETRCEKELVGLIREVIGWDYNLFSYHHAFDKNFGTIVIHRLEENFELQRALLERLK